MEKIFKFLGCTDSQKVNYATYMFEGLTEIWCYNDAHELLTGNMGSNKIRGIMLRSPEPIKVSLKSKVFKRMKNLKFLMDNAHIDKELDYQPHELRFLEWNVSPLSLSSKCLPPQQLVALKMSSFIVENVFKQDVFNDRIKHCLCHVAGDQINLQLVLVQASACFTNLEIAEHILEILFSKRLHQCETQCKHLATGYIWLMQLCCSHDFKGCTITWRDKANGSFY